jgi:NTP pyrophosphatase (non-canonical NTP hydrolase)
MKLSEVKKAIHSLQLKAGDGGEIETGVIKSELAEVLLYIVRLANRLGIDLIEEVDKKLIESANTMPKLTVLETGEHLEP